MSQTCPYCSANVVATAGKCPSCRRLILPATDTLGLTGGWQEVPATERDLPTELALPYDAPRIPGYRITGAIARGGMGRVWGAVDLELEREVALKTLLPNGDAGRFVTEAKITA